MLKILLASNEGIVHNIERKNGKQNAFSGARHYCPANKIRQKTHLLLRTEAIADCVCHDIHHGSKDKISFVRDLPKEDVDQSEVPANDRRPPVKETDQTNLTLSNQTEDLTNDSQIASVTISTFRLS